MLRAGQVAGSILRSEASEDELIQMMFEKQLTSRIVREDIPRSTEPILELISFNTHAEGAAVSLKNLNLKVFAGEIVGVAGVSGNGQKELCDAILGIEKTVSGKKLLKGQRFYPFINRQDAEFWNGFHPGKSANDGNRTFYVCA